MPPCTSVPGNEVRSAVLPISCKPAEVVRFGSNLSVLLAVVETHSLQTLHTILSTGSPLKAQSYDYVYRCIKSSILLGSISGTTPLCTCAVGRVLEGSEDLGARLGHSGCLPSDPASQRTGIYWDKQSAECARVRLLILGSYVPGRSCRRGLSRS